MPKPTRNNNHGGARIGAGRPRKYGFEAIVKIGQACEARWRDESKLALETRISRLPHADSINALHEGVQAIPVTQRRAWLESENYADHVGDLEAWLHDRAGTPFSDETEHYQGSAPRLITVSTKPPRGARVRIIAEIAKQSKLPEGTVDNLWQAYRRFEREPLEPQDSNES